MPLYLKSHSRGEYVFDYGAGYAYERAGGRYYPKLQLSVPFTPVKGKRLLTADGVNAPLIEEALLNGALQLVDRTGVIAASDFSAQEEWNRHGGAKLLRRTDQQFHGSECGLCELRGFLGALARAK